METISKQVATVRQGVSYNHVMKDGSRRIKVSIYSDSYDFQSRAQIYLWDKTEWKKIHSIPYSEMKTPHGLHHKPTKATAQAFAKDEAELLRIAKEVIS